MRNYILKMAIVSFLTIISTATAGFAQEASKADKFFADLVQKYDDKAGIDCIVATKGNGLQIVKMMFTKEFGKDFMKGVTAITMIDYSSATQEVSSALKKDLEGLTSLLEEFDLSKDKISSENEYLRTFASATDSGSINDFVLVVEKDSAKILLYMSGKIVIQS